MRLDEMAEGRGRRAEGGGRKTGEKDRGGGRGGGTRDSQVMQSIQREIGKALQNGLAQAGLPHRNPSRCPVAAPNGSEKTVNG